MDLNELEKVAKAAEKMRNEACGKDATGCWSQRVWNDYVIAAAPENILELIQRLNNTYEAAKYSTWEGYDEAQSIIRSQQALLRAYRTSTTNHHDDCYKVDHNGVKRDFRCADCVKNDALLPPIEEK
jgi:hypothetical protein